MSGQNRLLTYSSTNSDQYQLRKIHVDDLEGNRPKTRLKQSHLSISCSNTELNDDVNHKHACSNTVLRDSGHPLNVPYTYAHRIFLSQNIIIFAHILLFLRSSNSKHGIAITSEI